MEKWALVVGFDDKKLDDMKRAYEDYDIAVHSLLNLSEAIETLAVKNEYLIVAIFLYHTGSLSCIQMIRKLTNAPIIVLKEGYTGVEKIEAIKAGADEYIQWPETIQEFFASCHALLRRYTVLDRQNDRAENIVLQGNILIHGGYRKVFIHGIEMQFTSREYEVFKLLAAYPERVFTYDQMLDMTGGSEQIAAENSLHSCVRRIRRKLETIPECSCSIENVRSVGYCFRHKKTEK